MNILGFRSLKASVAGMELTIVPGLKQPQTVER